MITKAKYFVAGFPIGKQLTLKAVSAVITFSVVVYLFPFVAASIACAIGLYLTNTMVDNHYRGRAGK